VEKVKKNQPPVTGHHRQIRARGIRVRDDWQGESRGSAERRPSGVRNAGRASADSQHDQTLVAVLH